MSRGLYHCAQTNKVSRLALEHSTGVSVADIEKDIICKPMLLRERFVTQLCLQIWSGGMLALLVSP